MTAHARSRFLDKVLLRNVKAVLYVDGEPVREEFGEIGFSDRGIEGAVALRMSRDAVDALIDGKRVKLVLDLKPALTEEVLRERIAREIAGLQPNEFFGELLRKLVPKPLVMPLAQEMDIRANCYVGKLSEEQITRLIRTLKGLTFPVTDYAPFEYAVVTAGGVRCDEVNPYTMESLKVKGLYFAGEVLDIDANTGGYNLQIAFSTGRLAGLLKKIDAMKIVGHPISFRLPGRVSELRNRLSRARYFRGHGVHSPFVYDIVRRVFMRDDLLPGRRDLYEALLTAGVSRRRAVQLQNLMIHCGYGTFGLNRADAEFCVVTCALPRAATLALVRTAAEAGHTVALMSPYDGCERQALCGQIVAEHASTTVDNRGYLLIFNNHLPKQHFRI